MKYIEVNYMTLETQIEQYIPYSDEERAAKTLFQYFMNLCRDTIWHRTNLLGHITISAWITNTQRTKVLLIHHNIYNSWGWIGGHADGNPQLLHVARKEIAEETGLKEIKLLSENIFSINTLPVSFHYKNGRFVPPHMHFDVCFLFEADEHQSIRINKNENSGVSWFPIEDIIPSVTEEHMKNVYQKLMDKMIEF